MKIKKLAAQISRTKQMYLLTDAGANNGRAQAPRFIYSPAICQDSTPNF